ncbi:hypothetical protein [Marivita hallyeonensis]|nr:hypothetical protein [Marivita hallyeonensis]
MIALEAAAPTHSLRHRQGYNDLLGFGFFRETGAISAVVCAECSDPHTAQIKFEDSTYGYYCPELCFVELARERMNTVTPNLPFLIGQLADAFDCKRRKATPVYGETWRIGSVSTDQGDIVLCFLPRLSDEDDARQLADALSREVHAPSRLVVSAEGQLPISIAMTVTLNELVEMSPRNGCLIPQFDLCTLGDVP